MTGILSHSADPAYNLATEEFLLKNKKDDLFFIYINRPGIIVGKHQNTLAEINYSYILKNNIPVFRRLSGGGTVYHDLGNLNFCFITNEEKGSLVDFDKHSTPIVKALESLGLNITIGKRHDLSINGKKITGTASHVYKQRAMHHGTLLFSADLTVLTKCLNADYKKYSGKGVKSVKSEVTNISGHLKNEMSMKEFTTYIFNFLMSYFQDARLYHFSEKEISEINDLADEKYSRWEWNYGYSPVYEIERSINAGNITISSHIKVEKGLIKTLKFHTSGKTLGQSLKNLSSALLNIQHSKSAINNAIANNSILPHEQLFRLMF